MIALGNSDIQDNGFKVCSTVPAI